MQRPLLDIHGGRPLPNMMSRTDAHLHNSPFLRRNGLVSGKVANDTAYHMIHTKGKETGCTSEDFSSIATIAPGQISTIMCDATLSAAQKQRGAQALRACQQPAFSKLGHSARRKVKVSINSKLSEARAVWSLDKPPLHVDRRGLPMWPQSNKLNKPSNSVVHEGKLERAPSLLSPWTSDSEDSVDDCEHKTGAALLFFDRSSSAVSEPFPARSASLTWARTSLALHESKAKQTKSFVPDSQGLEKEEREMSYAALLQKVSKLETEKAVLQMKMEMLKADSTAENAKNQAELAQVKTKANANVDCVQTKADKPSAASKMASNVLMNIVDQGTARDDGGQLHDVLSGLLTRPSTSRASCQPTTLHHLNLGWASLEEEDLSSTPWKPFTRLQAEGLDRMGDKIKEHDDNTQELQRVEELNLILLHLVTNTSLDFLPHD